MEVIKYPNQLLNAEYISFDIETYDPNLLDKGPGMYRKDGYIIGCSLTDGNFAEYYNLGHPGITAQEKDINTQFIKDVLSQSTSTKVGTNIKYDIDWLENELDFKIKGQLIDIQIAEPLLNENQGKYNLDFQAQKYLGRGKFKTEIDDYCKKQGWKGDARAHLYKMPWELVRKYAIEDVVEPLEIWKIQKQKLEQEELMDLFNIEMKLTPLLLKMRRNGVRIDTSNMSKTRDEFIKIHKEEVEKFRNVSGKYLNINYNSANELGFLLNKLKIEYPLTEKTKAPSITKQWLLNNKEKHPVFELIHNCRKYEHMINTFLIGNMEEMLVGERIHCQFNQLKSDEYGTVSGRFSSSLPNLQQIPANDEDVGKLIRKLYIPEEGHDWIKYDYSQIEVRIIAHYAVGTGADEIRQSFIDNPEGTDFHQWCADLTGVTRKFAKKINFGIFYGMGVDKLAFELNMSREEGRAFMDMYFSKLPFIKKTLSVARTRAQDRGYVYTILKRRRRFPGKMFTHKAFNSVVQGSAADLMKKAMVDSDEAGLFDVLIPHLTVHDELDCSKPRTKEGNEAAKELKHIMESCITLKVPVIADTEIGPNWGSLEKFKPGEL